MIKNIKGSAASPDVCTVPCVCYSTTFASQTAKGLFDAASPETFASQTAKGLFYDRNFEGSF
jgi:hypothetical protein